MTELGIGDLVRNSTNANGVGMWALLSKCGKYRYELGRCWDPAAPLLGWIMLNPSTADGLKDDPTIRRCMGFARGWGFGGILVGNLFAFRSAHPKDLLVANLDVIGPECDRRLQDLRSRTLETICGWGSSPVARARKYNLLFPPDGSIDLALPNPVDDTWCLGRNADLSPTHPLYIRSDAHPTPYIHRPNPRKWREVIASLPKRKEGPGGATE